jgi:hypothetical protein
MAQQLAAGSAAIEQQAEQCCVNLGRGIRQNNSKRPARLHRFFTLGH